MKKRPPVGTYAWCEQHDGRLNTREKWHLIRTLVQAQLYDLIGRGLKHLPVYRRKLSRIQLDKVVFPDTSVARAAEEHLEQQLSQPLQYHCYRTYVWGTLLAQVDSLTFDTELLFVASLLHDLGLSDNNLSQAHTHCFAATGARHTYTFAVDQGWQPDQAVKAYEAVSLHLNPIINAQIHGVEAKLVGDGAKMDVIGSRRHMLPANVIREVHVQFPRHNHREEIVRTMLVQHAPDTRPAFLAPGFSFFAQHNPLDNLHYQSSSTKADLGK